jgi:hypothetical protein
MPRDVVVSMHFVVKAANAFERDLEAAMLPGETRSDAIVRIVKAAAGG